MGLIAVTLWKSMKENFMKKKTCFQRLLKYLPNCIEVIVQVRNVALPRFRYIKSSKE